MRRLVLDFLRQLVLFWCATVGVVSLMLAILPLLGYLAYSDRPGPGWYGLPTAFSWSAVAEHLGFVVSFALLGLASLPLLALYFAVPFAAIRLVERSRLPRVAVKLLGAGLVGVLAWITIASIGWYISLGWVAGAPGIIAGTLAGARCLPRRAADSVQAAA